MGVLLWVLFEGYYFGSILGAPHFWKLSEKGRNRVRFRSLRPCFADLVLTILAGFLQPCWSSYICAYLELSISLSTCILCIYIYIPNVIHDGFNRVPEQEPSSTPSESPAAVQEGCSPRLFPRVRSQSCEVHKGLPTSCHIHIQTYVCIYIYIEGEGERERERERKRDRERERERIALRFYMGSYIIA